MVPENKATVVLVDDHLMVRRGLRSALEGAPDIEVVGEACDAVSALEAVERLHPNVVFLDLQVPGANGLELCFKVIEANPGGRTVVLSAYLNAVLLRTCIEAGVAGYLMKDTETFSPTAVVRSVMRGESAYDAQVVNIMSAAFAEKDGMGKPLSMRELQVLQRMGRGFENQEIAEELHLSVNTVKGYAKDIMNKLGARNRTDAAVKALELGLI